MVLPCSCPLQSYMACRDAFALLFSTKVLNIRFASARNGHCRCLHGAVYENHPDVDDWTQTVTAMRPTDIPDLLNRWFGTPITVGSILQDNDWIAQLSFKDFVRISESSHCGLKMAILLGGRSRHVPCAEFLNGPITDTEFWQVQRACIKRKFRDAEHREYGFSILDQLSESFWPHCAWQSNRLIMELFWAKLQFQIQLHLSHGRELTVEQLLCDIGIFHGHRHLNTSSIPLLTSVQIPDRHYWHHWWKYWKFHTWQHCEPSERNVVLGILTFSLYVTRVCDTCNQELETQGYRIHPECGVQRWRHIFGSLMWAPAASRDMRFIDVNTS